jgi:hypothetical protein
MVSGVVVLLLSAVAAAESSAPVTISYCDLIRDPQSAVGKKITVRAVYRYGFELQRLDPADCCPGKRLKIWVEMGSSAGRSKKFLDRFPKGMGLALATFSGQFETGGPFGSGEYRFLFIVDDLSNVEAMAHPTDAEKPPWKIKDCSE